MSVEKDEPIHKLHKMWSVEDPWTKRRSQLVLTSERLVFLKKGKAEGSKSGLYIPLDHIAKAYSETTDTGDVILKLRLTNGDQRSIPFTYSTSMIMLGRPLLCAELRMEVERWVYAINTRLRKTTQ